MSTIPQSTRWQALRLAALVTRIGRGLNRTVLGAWLMAVVCVISLQVSAQQSKATDKPALRVNCRIGGKLYVDREFIGVVLKGYQYPVYDVTSGTHLIRIVGEDGVWERTVQITNVGPVVVEASKPRPPKTPACFGEQVQRER